MFFFHTYNIKDLNTTLKGLVKGRLWVKIIIGMFLGVSTGLLLGPSLNLIDREAAAIVGDWVSLPGHLFITLIQMIIVPLVSVSVIRGIAANTHISQLKKISVRAVVYFMTTTIIAISVGITVASLIKPGEYLKADFQQNELNQILLNGETITPHINNSIEWKALPVTMINILPANPIEAMLKKEMLQIVLFAIIIGTALVNLPSINAKPLLNLMGSIQAVLLTIVNWAMRLAPLAVFGLLAQVTMKTGIDILLGMGIYVTTVIIGLLILLCIYLIIVSLIGNKAPLTFLAAIREVQLLAFSTSSSAAVMPLSIKTAEEKLKIRPSISQFLIPLGTTINMDGTALYQGVATIFLAQVFGINLELTTLFIIVMVAVGASIGTPGTPGAGIIILSSILSTIGIPPVGIALLMGVDRILDMCRTSINVTGDLVACAVIDRWVKPKGFFRRILYKFRL